MATDNPPLNEEDDLFNFDDMNRGSAKPAVAPAPKTAAPASPVAVEPPPPAAQAKHKPAVPKLPQAPEPAAAPASPPSALPVHKTVAARVVEPVQRPAPQAPASAPVVRANGATLALLAVAALINLLLVGVVWSSMAGLGDVVREVGERAALAQSEREPQAEPEPPAWTPTATPAQSEGELALSTASVEIGRGEYERARTRLYSLLAVLDRFPAKARANLAARAQVLAADAYREQADAIEKDAAKQAAGFVDAPAEKQR